MPFFPLAQIGRNNGSDSVVRYEYDTIGRQSAMITGLGSVDAVGGNRTSYAYDNLGNLASVTDALNQAETYTYDSYGNITSKTDRNGIVTTYTYGIYGVIEEDVGGEKVTYTYDNLGRVTSKSNENSTITYEYDPFGRVAKETENGREKVYTYDANSNVTSFSLKKDNVAEYSLTYSYDNLNRLTSLTKGDRIFSYQYDANSRLTKKQTGDFVTNYTYNSAGAVTGLENLNSENVISRYSYGYTVDGNRISDIEENGVSKAYTYDLLGRLTTETMSNGNSYTFSYDAGGNRTAMTANGVSHTYTYDANNRLTSSSEADKTTQYAYDRNGNLLSELIYAPSTTNTRISLDISGDSVGNDNFKLYEYDKRNRVTHTYSTNTDVSYTYNPDGLRLSKNDTQYVWNGSNMIAEENGTDISYYTYDVTGIAMQTKNGINNLYHKNAHGDVTSLTDTNGTTLQSYTYDAFGNILSDNINDTNPFRYSGEYYDSETDSIYLRNRYYSPAVGRFITEDPIRDGFNWYVYCGNNPIMFVDPLGLYIGISGDDKEVVFENLQQLTRDELYYEVEDNGNWRVMYKAVEGDRLCNGTTLTRELIDSSYQCIIQTTHGGSYATPIYEENATESNIGTGGKIYFNATESIMLLTRDETTGKTQEEVCPKYIELGHEMIHVMHYMKGQRKSHELGTYAYTNKKGKIKITTWKREELETTGISFYVGEYYCGTQVNAWSWKITENGLRDDHGLRRRVMY